jgi:hypothetical protein
MESNSIDDLNQLAQAEFDDDPEAILALNTTYEAAKSSYLALYRMLRAKAAMRIDPSTDPYQGQRKGGRS